jgi:hypothetical protein
VGLALRAARVEQVEIPVILPEIREKWCIADSPSVEGFRGVLQVLEMRKTEPTAGTIPHPSLQGPAWWFHLRDARPCCAGFAVEVPCSIDVNQLGIFKPGPGAVNLPDDMPGRPEQSLAPRGYRDLKLLVKQNELVFVTRNGSIYSSLPARDACRERGVSP